MTTFFNMLKENDSNIAKTLVTILNNVGDYNINDSDIESISGHLKLSDLLSLNDAVEEKDISTIMDILDPYLETSFKEAYGSRSNTAAQNPNAVPGNREKSLNKDIPRTVVGSKPSGYSMAYSDGGTIAGNRKTIRQVKGGNKQPTGISTRSPEQMPTASVTKSDGSVVATDKKSSDEIDKILQRMQRIA